MKIEIEINGELKEFESGKINREKYNMWNETMEKVSDDLTNEDIIEMINCIVDIWNDQFTFEDVDKNLSLAEIVNYFINIGAEVRKEINTLQVENFMKAK